MKAKDQFKVTFSYKGGLRPAWATRNPVSKKAQAGLLAFPLCFNTFPGRPGEAHVVHVVIERSRSTVAPHWVLWQHTQVLGQVCVVLSS